MKRLLLILVILGLAAVGMAETKLRSYPFNGHTYTIYRIADGSTVEVKGDIGMKDAESLVKAQAIEAIVMLPPPIPRTPLSEYTDAEKLATISDAALQAEFVKRGLKLEAQKVEVVK